MKPMNKNRKITSRFDIRVIVVLFVAFSTFAKAQPDSLMQFSLGAGLSIPAGTFAKTSGDNDGFATTGLSVTAGFAKDINENTEWLTSAHMTLNSLDERALERLHKSSTGNYLNVWLLTGFQYHPAVNQTPHFYINAQIGALVPDAPNLKNANSPPLSFAYSLGAGISFARLDFTLRYLSSRPKWKKSDAEYYNDPSFALPVNVLIFCACLKF